VSRGRSDLASGVTVCWQVPAKHWAPTVKQVLPLQHDWPSWPQATSGAASAVSRGRSGAASRVTVGWQVPATHWAPTMQVFPPQHDWPGWPQGRSVAASTADIGGVSTEAVTASRPTSMPASRAASMARSWAVSRLAGDPESAGEVGVPQTCPTMNV